MDKIILARMVVFVLSWVNSYLVKEGLQPLPVVSEESVAYLFTFVVSVWTMFTHNSLAKKDKL